MNLIYYDILKLKTPVNAKPIFISTNIALFGLKSPSDISLSVYKPSQNLLGRGINPVPAVYYYGILFYRKLFSSIL